MTEATAEELERAFRDAVTRYHAGGAALMANLKPALLPRASLRVRLCLDEHGPHWLTLLCQCAWLRGVVGET